jgi:anti-sigma factor ChrR (cupin superfamily)
LGMRHLPDAYQLPYVLNDALTEAQRHHHTRHLEICPTCKQKVERTREAVNTPG